MKQQIARLSPHQNGKVFAVLMALGSFVFLVPVMVMASFMAPSESTPSAFMFLVLPVVYLVLGYLTVAFGCALYNLMFKSIGGIEFESEASDA